MTPESCSSSALSLLLRLENEGRDLTVVNGRLRISPGETLTPDQETNIRQYREELIGLVQFTEDIAG